MSRYSFDDEASEALNPASSANLRRYSLNPTSHPDSAFERLRETRQRAQSPPSQTLQYTAAAQRLAHAASPPLAPPHRDAQGRYWSQELGYTNSMVSNITPEEDNFSEQAGGGLAGIARGVADQRPRESGLEAMRNTPGYGQQYDGMGYDPRHEGTVGGYQNEYDPRHQGYGGPSTAYDPRHQGAGGYSNPYETQHNQYSAYSADHTNNNMNAYNQQSRSQYDGYNQPNQRQEPTIPSLMPLTAAAIPSAAGRPQYTDPYTDAPYNMRHSRNLDNSWELDPSNIEDDGDDGLEYNNHGRGSLLSAGHNSDRSNTGNAIAGGAAAGGILGGLGGLVGKNASGGRDTVPLYGQVSNPQTSQAAFNIGNAGEKSEWLNRQSSTKKKWAWIIGIVAGLLIAGGIAGGVTYAILSKKNSTSSSSSTTASGASAADDSKTNGDLNKDSTEIKALMGNKNLHKVFPGIDYTPMYTQYPDCLSYPASQNNVTRDIAVLSQLTNTIRLYGTDCNQTELVLHSIDQLGLNGTMKVWMGVWQDYNATTNARQLDQMYKVLADYGTSSFLGVIVGNEVLFRQDMTETALGTLLTGVKANFTKLGYSLPVATSDLGDSWTAGLAAISDYVMANVHPFFTGKDISQAAAFTWDFWHSHDFVLKPDLSKNLISETGWPSQGGTDCGSNNVTSCAVGSVAGITQLNNFMSDWVCQALTNGTNYFWFEAFDEPWKIKFNSGVQNWEDHWGLMDVDRNLKSGISIPDCGGKTV